MGRNTSIKRRDDKVAEGSVFDIANRRGERLEAVMADADIIVMLDVSSSMGARLGGGYSYDETSKTRFSEAVRALEAIQARYQGRVLVVKFNNTADFVLGGIPTSPSGGTNMLEALRLAKEFDGTGMKFTIISDGEPSNPEGVVLEASKFETPIDTIFIGDDHDQRGLELLNRVSAASHGKALGKVDVEDLGGETIRLLGEGSR